ARRVGHGTDRRPHRHDVTTILITAAGAPGAAALLRGLRENGEREVRIVGVDMSERSIGKHLCDAFHLVPPGSDPGYADAAHELGYPDRAVCFKPVFSSGSRGFRILDPTVDRAHQLLHERPGSVSMRLEEALELLPEHGGTELLVMELATGGERTIDGIADGERIVLGHPKTRESMRAGLAMYFVTLADDGLMEIADRTVREREIEWSLNLQRVGDHLIAV